MEGNGSTTSSLTSATLTHAPSMAQQTNGAGLNDSSAVAVFLDSTYPSNRHVFIQPPSSLATGSLHLVKDTLDNLAGQVVDQQQARLREASKKRKRETQNRIDALKLRKLHIDGFETGQVWQQVKKIITSTLEESTQLLEELEANNEIAMEDGPDTEGAKVVEFGEDGFEVDSDDEDASASSESGSEADSEDQDEEDEDGSDVSDEEDLEGDLERLDEERSDLEMEDEEEEEEGVEGSGDEDEDEDEEESGAELQEDPDGLNDGFFSLKDFNRQTLLFEAQDARADPNADDDSDDESVNWHKDPFTPSAKGASGGVDIDDEEEESDVDMEEPAAKPSKPQSKKAAAESEDEDDLGLEDMEMDLTANDVYYKDFFAPPAKKKKNDYFPKKRKAPEPSTQADEAEIERAQNDVRRDLFEDESERSDSEDALSDASAGNPKSRRSAHERRQTKLAAEIRKLESELVAKRAWTLSGEASAVDRPVNSLLEEDLDFEHAGKPVPIITEEVSESIEALIKRRILAQEFDEVLRRRPDTLGNPNGARRGIVDLDLDKDGKKSLAELYEEEHAKNTDPDAYVSKNDEKLSRDEEEIKQMWKDISSKLDALSSWHYKPKPAAPTLTVVADVATVAMEDAQPTTAQGVAGGESRMAPQEIYAPGKATAEQGELVARSGLPIARQEMTREDKLRRRRRDKERIRKAGGLDATKPLSKKAKAERETTNELKKGGVKVINRKGEVVGLDGKKVSDKSVTHTSGSLKL